MKKIPTIFVRDHSQRNAPITREWHPDCHWVRDGEGRGTRKWDGTSCRWDGTALWKRRELKSGQPEPLGFVLAGHDETTGKTVGWVQVDTSAEDRWHNEALACTRLVHVGTYELCGPKVNGNPERIDHHTFILHGDWPAEAPRDFGGIADFLRQYSMEGIVWHHPDGRMAKIKSRDFGIDWPAKIGGEP